MGRSFSSSNTYVNLISKSKIYTYLVGVVLPPCMNESRFWVLLHSHEYHQLHQHNFDIYMKKMNYKLGLLTFKYENHRYLSLIFGRGVQIDDDHLSSNLPNSIHNLLQVRGYCLTRSPPCSMAESKSLVLSQNIKNIDIFSSIQVRCYI
jgi:hypothetical protein